VYVHTCTSAYTRMRVVRAFYVHVRFTPGDSYIVLHIYISERRLLNRANLLLSAPTRARRVRARSIPLSISVSSPYASRCIWLFVSCPLANAPT